MKICCAGSSTAVNQLLGEGTKLQNEIEMFIIAGLLALAQARVKLADKRTQWRSMPDGELRLGKESFIGWNHGLETSARSHAPGGFALLLGTWED